MKFSKPSALRTTLHSLFLGAILISAPAMAQDDVTIVEVLTATVRPGAEGMFEEFVAAYRQASEDQGLENYWQSAQSVSGEPTYRFHMARPNWASLADPGPVLAKTFGERETERLQGLLRDSVTSLDIAFFRRFASMSHVPANGFAKPPEALIYYDFALNPGTAPLFQEMATAQQKASAALYPEGYFVASMPDFGATGPRTILILDSFENLDIPSMPPQQRILEHFGETEGGRLNELGARSIASFSATLFRARPDLNYQPGE
ncbi:MAG: hypothetical protein ACWGPN_12610 [Gammaproteobacteria bacterium]